MPTAPTEDDDHSLAIPHEDSAEPGESPVSKAPESSDGEIVIPHGSSALKIEAPAKPAVQNTAKDSKPPGPAPLPEVKPSYTGPRPADGGPYDMFAELDKDEAAAKAAKAPKSNQPDLSARRSTSDWWRPDYHGPSNIGTQATAAAMQPKPANNMRKILLASGITVGVIVLIVIAIVIVGSLDKKSPQSNVASQSATSGASGTSGSTGSSGSSGSSNSSGGSSSGNSSSSTSSGNSTNGSSSSATYVEKSITNDGYTYSFLFDKSATLKNNNGTQTLTGYDLQHKFKVTIAAYHSTYSGNCNDHYTNLGVAFDATIDGGKYAVCAGSDLHGTITNFKYKDTWQEIDIDSVSNQSIGIDTLKTIINSFTIKQ